MKSLVFLAFFSIAFAENHVKIVGGYECEPHSQPWMAFLKTSFHQCGGFLINQNWIMSAAHCYDTRIEVRLGKHNIAVDESSEQSIPSERVIRHPQFNYSTIDNDIMLIKLRKPVTLNKFVKPVDLPKSCAPPDTMCRVSGWGITMNETVDSDKLQCLNLSIISDRDCNESYPDLITASMFCAGYLKGGKGVCQGDSGGPMVCDGEIQGIVSAGGRCAAKDQPGIFTKVCLFNSWITETINTYQN
ncbi:trypsin-2-like [Sinocyclocheilus rhinocerous]|uniref:trypsin-2-like n=1 Tax=Sinocyclocheilus rhinocerous TaxID=307959 RepID=UPI0007B99028|nr:PREDICTED: trypsin-2-like [Sinocyclocheilus rhinocerous]